MLQLPDRNSDEGVESRVLLAECPGPANPNYTIELASEAMQLMDAVLWNRMKNPGPFLAAHAKSLADVVRARGQFRGFEKYPDYNAGIINNIQNALDIANNPKDARSAAYIAFVNKAVEIEKSANYKDPSPGKLASWRAANSGTPGKGFLFYKTVFGNDFYYQ